MKRDKRQNMEEMIVLASIIIAMLTVTLIIFKYDFFRQPEEDTVEAFSSETEEPTTDHKTIMVKDVTEDSVAGTAGTSCTEEPSTEESTTEEIETSEAESEVETTEPTKEESTEVIEETTEPVPDYQSMVIGTFYVLPWNGVHIRTEPNTDSSIYCTLDQFSEIQVIDDSWDWATITIDNKLLYVFREYIGTEEDMNWVKYQQELEAKRQTSPYYHIFKNMTNDEYHLLALTLALEAGNQSFLGKVATVEVILNRCISSNWPNTVSEVIYAPGQFAVVPYFSHPYNLPDDDEYQVIEYLRDAGASAIRQLLDQNGMYDIPETDYVYFATYKANGRDFIHLDQQYFSRR